MCFRRESSSKSDTTSTPRTRTDEEWIRGGKGGIFLTKRSLTDEEQTSESTAKSTTLPSASLWGTLRQYLGFYSPKNHEPDAIEPTLNTIRQSNETVGIFPHPIVHLYHDMTGFTPKNLSSLPMLQPNSTHSIPAMPNMSQALLRYN